MSHWDGWDDPSTGDVSDGTGGNLTENSVVIGGGDSTIDISNLTVSVDGNDLTVPGNLSISTALTDATLQVLSTTEQLRLNFDASFFASFTVSGVDQLTISSGSMIIDSDAEIVGTLVIQSDTADTSSVLTLETTGTNGAPFSSFVGTQDPEGIITGAPGDHYNRANGINSDLFIFEGASAGTTGWTSVFNTSDAVKVTFAEMQAISSPSAGDRVFVTDAQVQAYFSYNTTLAKWTAPQYTILNNANGSALAQGDIVVLATGTDFSVATTVVGTNDPQLMGVVVVGRADSTDVLVKINGEVLVNKNTGTVNRREFISSSTTAGEVGYTSGSGIGDIGKAMQTTADTQVRILISGTESF